MSSAGEEGSFQNIYHGDAYRLYEDRVVVSGKACNFYISMVLLSVAILQSHLICRHLPRTRLLTVLCLDIY